ncbi:MAG: DUF1552 domain-containing protein [Rubripirellula sp.]|nr:DUF1552 domain-containing protein [Rubripirellula sp.]
MRPENSIDRRTLLKSSGVAVALPWLEAMKTTAHAAQPNGDGVPRRMVLINLNLGLYAPALFPQQAGTAFEPSEYLEHLDQFRDQYTVIAGLSHPGVVGGHAAEARIFNGTPSSQKMGVSLDQYAAKFLGGFTRFDTLPLGMGNANLTWSVDGSPVPAESRMSMVFQRLFADESISSKQAARKAIERSGSILDLINAQAKRLTPRISNADQVKMDEFFTSVREAERRLAKSESWLDTPKPKVDIAAPVDPASRSEFNLRMQNLFDITYLAFKTDATRIITFNIFEQNSVTVDGVNNGYHNLSHHGKDPGNISQLKRIETEIFEQLRHFLDRLKQTQEQNATLLDRTTVLLTSNLGNASSHSNRNLPVLLAGGDFKHGQHLVFDPPDTTPLCNLFVSMLQQLNIETDTFGTSTGTLANL